MVVAFSFATLGGYWTNRAQMHAKLEAAALQEMERRASALSEAVSEQTRSVVYNLDLALHHLAAEFVERGRIGDRDALAVVRATPPGLVHRVMLIDPTGRATYAFPSGGEERSHAARLHFSTHRDSRSDRLFVGPPIEVHADGDWVIPFSRPLRDARGRFAGVILLLARPEHFSHIYARLVADRDDVVALVHRDGMFLSRNLNLYDHLGQQAPADRPFVGARAPESGVFRSVSSLEPVDRIFAFRRLSEWPLVTVVGLGVAETLAPIRAGHQRDRQSAIAVSALVLLLAAGTCIVVLRLERSLVRARESDDRRALAFAGAAELAWEWEIGSGVRFFGDCQPFLGRPGNEQQLMLDEWMSRIHPEDIEMARARILSHLRNPAMPLDVRYRLRVADGHYRWVLVRGRTVERTTDRRVARVIGILMDIDAERQAELLAARTKEAYQRLIESAGEGIFVVDEAGDIALFNPAAERLLGWNEADVRGRNAYQLFSASGAADAEACPLARTLRDGQTRRGERLAYRHKDGALRPVELSVAPIRIDGRMNGAVVLITDIAQRLAYEAELERLARTDMLTGVSNRRYFVELVEREIKRASRDSTPLSLLMIDLDHFKRINDQHGHAAGDAVLIEVTSLLREQLREIDTIGRLGGEEFAIALPGISLSEALIVADRLRTRLAERGIAIGDEPVICSASFGAAMWRPGEGFDDMLARADAALYEAKDAGRNRVVAEHRRT